MAKQYDHQSQLLQERYIGQVSVNIRMLIDKILARYSSKFFICRELIQNADDAQATWFHFDITCSTSNNTHYSQEDKLQQHRARRLSGNTRNGLQKVTYSAQESSTNALPLSEKDFHNKYITEIRASNNGHPFTETDWKRVATIAEGNTDVDSVGQFGVGFFSVFSLSEEPIIVSGHEYMLFDWENDNLLTSQCQLPADQENQPTTIILGLRKRYTLLTDTNSTSDSSTKLTQSESARNEDDIVQTMNLTKLKKYFVKVLSFTKHITHLIIRINGLIVFQITKKKTLVPINELKSQFNMHHSIHNLLRFQSFVHNKQTFTIANGPSLTLDHVSVKASVIVSDVFQQHVRQILKKTLPSTIHIELLFGPYSSLANNDILGSLIPLKLEHDQIIPAGHIFIGLGTQQSTGIGMHIYSHFIPTVERENLDFQDPKLSEWNEELLLSAGQIARFIYDQAMSHISSNTTIQDIQLSLSPFSFQSTAPQNEIGDAIQSGFFHNTTDLLVPVRQSPSDSHISLVPSQQTYLTESEDIEKFLTLPLVPFELSKSKFFVTVRRYRLIRMMNNQIIEQIIPKIVLSLDELIHLLLWLCKNKGSVKSIFEYIRYRESANSHEVTLTNIQHYISQLNIPSNLPLPPTVLPTGVTNHFSSEQLNHSLSLTEYPVRSLISFYSLEDQTHLKNHATSIFILSLISQNLNLFSDDEWNKIKLTLSKIKCIPTSHGMKLPSESYIPSSILSSSVLPIIKLNIVQTERKNIGNNGQSMDEMENGVTSEFLKYIGCHTFHLQSFLDARSLQTSGDMKKVIQQLIEERKNMTESDFDSLKKTKWLQGTTCQSDRTVSRQYIPDELCFPSIAIELGWPDLRIVNYCDFEPNSPEYNFLKDLGVHEVPELQLLINHIVQEHNKQTLEETTKDNYEIPKAFCFLIKHFVLHYRKSWNKTFEQNQFIPSSHSLVMNRVILSPPNQIFIDDSPLCPVLLDQVIELFNEYSVEPALFGIKQSPDVEVAFSLMLKRKDEFLMNKKSASIIFGYLCKIYQWNKAFNEKISTVNFIPLKDYYLKKIILKKPTEIFVHRNKSETGETEKKNVNTHGLVDYVDFGEEGNRFLENIGVKTEPSITHLAELLLDRQERYFSETNKDNADLFMKCKIYTHCLKRLAVNISKLEGEDIKRRLKNEAWCLGYRCLNDTHKIEQEYKIRKPNAVYINDNDIYAKKLKPFCASSDEHLIELYVQFGSKYLSACVEKIPIISGERIETEKTKKLSGRITERLNMLFVNNKGEALPNLKRDCIKPLRKLSVYEIGSLQYQLKFEGGSVMFNSNESSSCELILDNNKVILYLRKDVEEIIYYDVARALAEFMFTTVTVDISLISNKLALSEAELKQRGIPVELLKSGDVFKQGFNDERLNPSVNSPSVDNSNEQLASKKPQNLPSNSSQKKRDITTFDNQPEKLYNEPTNDSTNAQKPELVQKIKERTFHHDPIPDFRPHHSFDDDHKIKDMIKDCQPYDNKIFTKDEDIEQYIEHCCEINPAIDMTRHKILFHSIPLYVERNVVVTELMLSQANQFAWLLSNLAKNVFDIPVISLHLYRDINGRHIAFNREGALFFNLRYYEQVFSRKLENLQNPTQYNDIVLHIVNFYYMVTCHELAHNIVHGHDKNFIAALKTFASKYLSERAKFIQYFSFNDA